MNNYYFQFSEPCRILQRLTNGWIEHTDASNRILSYGDVVTSDTSIAYLCGEKYMLDGADINFCINGQWENIVPICRSFCYPNEITTTSIKATECTLNGVNVNCSEPLRSGTIASIKCRNRYESANPADGRQMVTCDEEGQWTPKPQICTPICGETANDALPLIIGGSETSITKVPWQAAIYRIKKSESDPSFVCSGTIISARIILSAMHCFWNTANKSPVTNLTVFRVVVGKTLVQYNAIEPLKPQFSEIVDVKYSEYFRSYEGQYAADLSIVILKNTIEFRMHIAPACIFPSDKNTLKDGIKGLIAGWGFTSYEGDVSNNLKVVNLPFVSKAKCESYIDQHFNRYKAVYAAVDKLCVGDPNSNDGACNGDSGSGFVYPYEKNGTHKNYLGGILSAAPDKCDTKALLSFISVDYFRNFILSVLKNIENN